MSTAAEALLVCQGLTVRFGGLEALSDLSLTVERDQVLGIAGPERRWKDNPLQCDIGPCETRRRRRRVLRPDDHRSIARDHLSTGTGEDLPES